MANFVMSGYLLLFMLAALWKTAYTQCSTEPTIANGQVSNFIVDTTYTVICDPGFVVDATAGTTASGIGLPIGVADCTTTTAPSITCVCDTPAVVSGTVTTASATTYDVTCNTGFILSTTGTTSNTGVACSAPAPTCVCNPPTIEYARDLQISDDGSSYTYQCLSGWQPSTTTAVPCGATPPTCDCVIPTVPNGAAALTSGSRGTYDVTCNAGYTASAPSPIKCYKPCPTCDCTLPEILHGINIEVSAGLTTYTYGCEAGYNPFPPGPIACGSTPPTCANINECTVNPNLCGPNSICVDNDGSYYCLCEVGFEWGSSVLPMPGSSPPGCSAVTTQALDCGFPPVFENAYYDEVDFDDAVIARANPLQAHCKPGWRSTIGPNIGGFDFQCIAIPLSSPAWTVNGACTVDINECQEWPGICGLNAKCINKDGWFNCDCDDGYMWDETMPLPTPGPVTAGSSYCIESRCSSPGVYPGGTYNPLLLSDTKVGQTGVVTCNKGWEVSTGVYSFQITCTDTSGTLWWDDAGYSCEPREDLCTFNPCGTYGRCVARLGTFDCLCDNGFRWNGLPINDPVDNINYGGDCEKVTCYDDPPSVSNAMIQEGEGEGQMYKDEVVYECKPGYRPSFHLYNDINIRRFTLSCTDESSWETKAYPTCEKISCGHPRLPSNAKMTGSDFLFGDVVTFTCNPGFRPSSGGTGQDMMTTCETDGDWSFYGDCEDVKECMQTPPICGSHTCIEKIGSYKCSCDFGYKHDATGKCVKIPIVDLAQLGIGSDITTVGCTFLTTIGLCNDCRYSAEGRPYCNCRPGQTGPFCVTPSGPNPYISLILAIAALVLFLILTTILVIVCMTSRLRPRASAETYVDHRNPFYSAMRIPKFLTQYR